MNAIICTGQSEFDAINAQLLDYFQSVLGGVAERWSEPIIHPVDGRIAICVEQKVSPALTWDQSVRVEFLTSDWFGGAA